VLLKQQCCDLWSIVLQLFPLIVPHSHLMQGDREWMGGRERGCLYGKMIGMWTTFGWCGNGNSRHGVTGVLVCLLAQLLLWSSDRLRLTNLAYSFCTEIHITQPTTALRQCKLRQGRNVNRKWSGILIRISGLILIRMSTGSLPKMLWIHCLVDISHFAKFREKNRPMTDWEMAKECPKLS